MQILTVFLNKSITCWTAMILQTSLTRYEFVQTRTDKITKFLTILIKRLFNSNAKKTLKTTQKPTTLWTNIKGKSFVNLFTKRSRLELPIYFMIKMWMKNLLIGIKIDVEAFVVSLFFYFQREIEKSELKGAFKIIQMVPTKLRFCFCFLCVH